MSWFRTSDGIALSFVEEGRPGSPCVLLSNSLGTDRDLWRDQARELATRFRVVRYDGRGHGRSDAPPGDYTLERLGCDALELMDHLGTASAAVCGVSLGGMVGQWLGVHAPDRVAALALCNTSPHLGPAESWNARVAAVRSGGLEAVADAVLERWLSPSFRAGHPGEVERARKMLLATPLQGYIGCCAAIRDMDLRPLLTQISAPTIVVGGSEDPATPLDHAREIASRVPGASLTVLPSAHLPTIEQPAALSAVLADFLAETLP